MCANGGTCTIANERVKGMVREHGLSARSPVNTLISPYNRSATTRCGNTERSLTRNSESTREGLPMTVTRKTPTERLAAGLERKPNGCLEWTGGRMTKGYGRISVNGKRILTHRLAWILTNGPILNDLWVLHHCDNPPCCQTEPTEGYPNGHLFLGSSLDNNADMTAKGRHGRHTLGGHRKSTSTSSLS